MALRQLKDTQGRTVTVDVPRRRGGGGKKKKNGKKNGTTWSIGQYVVPVVITTEAILGGGRSALRSPLDQIALHNYGLAAEVFIDNIALETLGSAPLGSYGPEAAVPFSRLELPTGNVSAAIAGVVAHKVANRLQVNARIGRFTKMLTGERIVI